MNFTYETEHLILKVCGQEIAKDALKFFQHNKKEFEAVEPIDHENFYNLDHQKNILNYEYKMTLQLSVVRFWIYQKDNPYKIIGTVCFRNIVKPIYSSCTVGYKMDKDYTGRGFCKEALTEGIRVMFEDLGLHKIDAIVLPRNDASIAILEGLGFKREGLLRDKIKLNGKWEDHYAYSLLESEFN